MTILVLGGGADQAALIKELQNRNHEVILLDYLPDCPAKSLVKKHIQENTLDLKTVEKCAVAENVDLICTACTDQALLTMAYVSEKLNLPCYISYETALNVTNKRYMKNLMKESGIPTAPFEVITHNLGEKLPADLHFPLVVKPADCNSSKGVRKAYNMDDYKEILATALDMSRSHTAIVENFVEGTEISADLYIHDHKAYFLSATTSMKIKKEDRFTIIGSSYPAVDADGEIEIRKIGQQIADSFKLNNCPLLIQMIYNNGGFFVIEFSARMGGGSKYYLINTLSGVDIMKTYVDLILGGNPGVAPKKQVNHAIMKYIYCNNGIIGGFENFEEAKKKGIITNYFIYKVPGAEIEKVETSGDRAAGYLVTAETHDLLKEKMARADAMLRVIDVNDNDIAIHNQL